MHLFRSDGVGEHKPHTLSEEAETVQPSSVGAEVGGPRRMAMLFALQDSATETNLMLKEMETKAPIGRFGPARTPPPVEPAEEETGDLQRGRMMAEEEGLHLVRGCVSVIAFDRGSYVHTELILFLII